MKRSSCDSGSGKMPSCSYGFWVAITRNGSGSWCARPSTVTVRSCIASSSAACVAGRGAVDLVGEEDVREDDAGQEDLLAHLGRVDADDLVGRRVGRELDALELRAEHVGHRAPEQRLGAARGALDQDVPLCERGDEQQIDDAAPGRRRPCRSPRAPGRAGRRDSRMDVLRRTTCIPPRTIALHGRYFGFARLSPPSQLGRTRGSYRSKQRLHLGERDLVGDHRVERALDRRPPPRSCGRARGQRDTGPSRR